MDSEPVGTATGLLESTEFSNSQGSVSGLMRSLGAFRTANSSERGVRKNRTQRGRVWAALQARGRDSIRPACGQEKEGLLGRRTRAVPLS